MCLRPVAATLSNQSGAGFGSWLARDTDSATAQSLVLAQFCMARFRCFCWWCPWSACSATFYLFFWLGYRGGVHPPTAVVQQIFTLFHTPGAINANAMYQSWQFDAKWYLDNSQHIALIMQRGPLIASTCNMAVHCLTCKLSE